MVRNILTGIFSRNDSDNWLLDGMRFLENKLKHRLHDRLWWYLFIGKLDFTVNIIGVNLNTARAVAEWQLNWTAMGQVDFYRLYYKQIYK